MSQFPETCSHSAIMAAYRIRILHSPIDQLLGESLSNPTLIKVSLDMNRQHLEASISIIKELDHFRKNVIADGRRPVPDSWENPLFDRWFAGGRYSDDTILATIKDIVQMTIHDESALADKEVEMLKLRQALAEQERKVDDFLKQHGPEGKLKDNQQPKPEQMPQTQTYEEFQALHPTEKKKELDHMVDSLQEKLQAISNLLPRLSAGQRDIGAWLFKEAATEKDAQLESLRTQVAARNAEIEQMRSVGSSQTPPQGSWNRSSKQERVKVRKDQDFNVTEQPCVPARQPLQDRSLGASQQSGPKHNALPQHYAHVENCEDDNVKHTQTTQTFPHVLTLTSTQRNMPSSTPLSAELMNHYSHSCGPPQKRAMPAKSMPPENPISTMSPYNAKMDLGTISRANGHVSPHAKIGDSARDNANRSSRSQLQPASPHKHNGGTPTSVGRLSRVSSGAELRARVPHGDRLCSEGLRDAQKSSNHGLAASPVKIIMNGGAGHKQYANSKKDNGYKGQDPIQIIYEPLPCRGELDAHEIILDAH